MPTKPIGGPSNRKPQPGPELTLEEKLQNAIQKRDLWRQVAARPELKRETAAFAASLAQSWDAAAPAYQKALMPEEAGAPNTDPYLLGDPHLLGDPYLLRLLMPEQLAAMLLGSPSPNPPTSSPQSEQPSTKPETSTGKISTRRRR